MKKLVLASAMALASVSLVSAPVLRAQDSSQITIQDPAEYNAYQNASTQSDPAAKAAALESFLQTYPQSVVKKTVLQQLMQIYSQQTNQPDKALSAATRLLQVDPNDMTAIYLSVYLKKQQCGKNIDASTGLSTDPQTCDDSAALAQKGLTVAKPASTADADWKTMTAQAYPLFHSAIALDDLDSKKDFAGAIQEYKAELQLYSLQQTTSGQGLVDTVQLAQAYAKPGPSRDEVMTIWFYARAWNYLPTSPHNYKADIEQQLDYWYKRYHGTIDTDAQITQQINAIKAQAQATLFPPPDFKIAPAPTPAELAHHALTTNDPKTLGLEDKEYILANGSTDDANTLWALLKDQQTPVQGVVISDNATVLKISATLAASPKPKDFVVKLTTPAPCGSVPPGPPELKVKDAQDYILANGVKADTDALGDVLTGPPAHIRKLSVEPAITAINVAVTQGAKDSHVADFIVNMKEPLSCKEAPAPGATLATQPAEELDATYDTYTKNAATATADAFAQIVLRDGFLQSEAKKAPVHHPAAKPSPAHHPGM